MMDARLADLLLRRQELRERGEDLSDAAFADCPELKDEYCRRVRALEHMEERFSLAQEAQGFPPPDDPERTTTFLPAPAEAGSPQPLSCGVRVAGYEILGELGRGGMGVVYRARQVGLNRLVALKMIRAGEYAEPAQLARFRAEAEAVARLQHPNVVQIFEVGTHGGLPFFSCELAEGGSLAQRLDGTPWSADRAAGLMETLARAVHAAHRAGVVHRDLKPGNVLLATDGTPKVADFGLAKRLDQHASLQTPSGAVLGTPSYMAPEQASGRSQEVGPAADVFALGAILYELLTGRPPFKAATTWDTIAQLLGHEPVPPRLLNPAVPADLETVCLKCLEKDPARRYESAAALADDLRRFLQREPILARGVHVLDRLGRALGRMYAPGAMDLQAFGNILLGWALVTAAVHLAVFGLTLRAGSPGASGVTPVRVAQYVAMGVVFGYYRWGQLLPATILERQLWAIVAGYVLSCVVAWQAASLMGGPNAGELSCYPVWSVLSGLAFFVLGSNVWGRCYLFALAFFAAALLMPLRLQYAPLAYGLLWASLLVVTGLRLRQLGRETTENRESGGL